MKRAQAQTTSGFTLVELLVVMAIIGLLIALALPALNSALTSGRAAASMSNLRELAAANLTYTSEHDGYYCPAQDVNNLIRWHGGRTTTGAGDDAAFDPAKGYLSPYLGTDGRVKECPLFANMVTGSSSFENGSGGYGYNEVYIGGTPTAPWPLNYQPTCVSRVPRPSQTIMFTTTALAKVNGLQEYPFCEPYQFVDPNGNLDGAATASVHFRDHGRALVAWCDGHVTAELPAQLDGVNLYGGNSTQDNIGWFGPSDNNGYWNPAYTGAGP